MKVLCDYTACGPSFVRSGWGRVFLALGHEFRFWERAKKAPLDAFAEYEPDLYIGTTYDLDRATCKAIYARPDMKVALFASAWGPYVADVDRDRYPLILATDEEKRRVSALRAASGKPDVVFIHAHGHWLDGTMSGWSELGVPYLGLLNAADLYVYLGGIRKPELACDLGFVGGRWPYKARNLDRYLLPLCHPDSGLTIKIFGSGWPTHRCLGYCTDRTARDLFASAAVCPNVSEPHSTELGWDWVERPQKILAAGGFCVSDYVPEGRDLFAEDEVPMAETPKEFEGLVRHYAASPDERLPFMAKARRKVLLEHTYHDRVHDLLAAVGLGEECQKVLALKASLLEGEL